MEKIVSKITNWFYTTWLGDLYFRFLLWRDEQNERNKIKYLTPKEMAQVIRQYSILGEGVKEMKSKVNTLIQSKNKDEYDRVLKEIEDMVTLAEREANDPKSQFVHFLKSGMDLSNSDIKSVTDRAKMVDKRINHMYELQSDKVKRQLLRDIRKAEQDGNEELVVKLKTEFKDKYGTRRN
jgi:hypothetical protein